MSYQYPYNNSYNSRKKNDGLFLTKLTKQLAGILIVILFLLMCKYVKTGVTETINNKIKSIISLDYTNQAKTAFSDAAPNVNNYFNNIINKFSGNKEFKMDYLPVEGTIVSNFGKNIDSKTKKEIINEGVDINVKSEANVKAIFDGTIDTVENDKTNGLMIIIDHNDGFKTVYSNLSETSVNEGETIVKGSVIGTANKSVKDAVNKFHFEVLKNDTAVNPIDYLKK